MEVTTLLETAIAAARAGGAELRARFGDQLLVVHEKAANDFVTEADHASEKAVLAVILERHPDHAILSEEGGGGDSASKPSSPAASHVVEWVVDPLDGTTNFLQGLPFFAVSIGCRRGADLLAGVVYDPLTDRLFAAGTGLGATLNGQPIQVSERPGLKGAFLATGYPFRAHRTLDRYLNVFREVFLEARAIRRCGSAALDLAYTAAGVFDGFFEFRLSPWDLVGGAVLLREAGGVITDLEGGSDFLERGNVVAAPPAIHRELLAAVRRHADEAALAESADANLTDAEAVRI